MATLLLTIQRRAAGGFPVVAELTVAGQLPTRAEGLLQLDQIELLSLLDPLAYGTLLGQGVFSRGIRDAFVRARGGAEVVRTLLFVEAPELRTLRWERLCGPLDDDRWDLLARDPRVPLSIYLPSAAARRFLPFGRADLRALVLVASPPGLERFGFSPFDAAGALRMVRDGLGDIPHDCLADAPGAFGPPTLRALGERLVAGRYTLLHVVCHGLFRKDDGETAILIAGEDGRAEPVEAARLIAQWRALTGAHGLPHFVFLATCESADPRAEAALGGLAHRLVRELGVPAVLAMTEKVSQATALALGKAFYPRLREHGEVDRALVEAMALLGERFDAAVPALYSRLGERPLFSDDLARPLTPTELRAGLRALEGLLPVRAPSLAPQVAALAVRLGPVIEAEPAALSEAARGERAAAIEELDALCREVADLSLAALALGKPPPGYDATCPFPGLQAFTGDEQRFFFGRDGLLDRLVREVETTPFLAVLGQSGSGKSSAVLAGLVPRIRRARPELGAVAMVPGTRPLIRLEKALEGAGLAEALARARTLRTRRRGGASLLATAPPAAAAILVVDQLEEAFTLCDEEAARVEFFELLLALTRELLVVVTLRADFLGEIAPYAELRKVIERHPVLVAPMTPTELRAAIEQQAAAVGLRFDGDLIATILEDVQAEPGAMPLLQHALLELWRRRRGRWLRTEAYRDLGGVSRAIAETADAIYRALDDHDRERVRRLFTRLTRVDAEAAAGAERRDTRRRVAIADLVPAGEAPAATERLLARLVGARLLVTAISPQTGRETVEVCHEALIRRWPRLQQWIGEDLEVVRKHGQLEEAAKAWDGGGRVEDLVVHWDARLAEIEALVASGRMTLNQLEVEYVGACAAARERERRREVEEKERELAQARAIAEAERRRAEAQEAFAQAQVELARRLRLRSRVIASVGVIAIVMAIASGLLYVRAERAQRDVAEKQQIVEQTTKQAEASASDAHDIGRIAAVERIGGDSSLQAVLLREVRDLETDARRQELLLDLANEPRALAGFEGVTLRAIEDPSPGASALFLDATGERLLHLEQDGALTLRDVAARSVLWTMPAQGEARPAALVPAGDGVFVLGGAPGYLPVVPTQGPAIAIPLLRIFDVDAGPGEVRALAQLGAPAPCPAAAVRVALPAGTVTTTCLARQQEEVTQALLLPALAGALLGRAAGPSTIVPLTGGEPIATLTRRRGATRGREALLRAARNQAGTRVVLVADDEVAVWTLAAPASVELATSRSFGQHTRLWGAWVDGEAPIVVDPAGLGWMFAEELWSPIADFSTKYTRQAEQPSRYSPAARTWIAGVGKRLWAFDCAARRTWPIRPHSSNVVDLAFSADGRRFASYAGGALRVWRIDDPRAELTWSTPQRAARLLDVAGDGRQVLFSVEGATGGRRRGLVARLDDRGPLASIGEDVIDARFLPPDNLDVAIHGETGTGVAGALPPTSPTTTEWDRIVVFADAARTFVAEGRVWGVRADGSGWVAAPPVGPIDGAAFTRDGEKLLVWRREGPTLATAAVFGRSGPEIDLRRAPHPLAEVAARTIAWSPDGSRLLAAYAREDAACVVHWSLADPAAARHRCARAGDIPGVEEVGAGGSEPRGAAWSPDGARIVMTVGNGNALFEAAGEAPPRWLETWSERWEPTRLQIDRRGERIVEATPSGIYLWSLARAEKVPYKLVDFEAHDPPAAVAARLLAEDRGVLTVALVEGDLGVSLTTRRWSTSIADARAELERETPVCPDVTWRKARLGEAKDEALANYCACRATQRLPDPACAAGGPIPPA